MKVDPFDWRITGAVRREGIPGPATEASVDQQLGRWYYKAGGAMYLTWQAADLLFRAWDQLRDPAKLPLARFRAFSRLRTQLKVDCGIYDEAEAEGQLFELRDFR